MKFAGLFPGKESEKARIFFLTQGFESFIIGK